MGQLAMGTMQPTDTDASNNESGVAVGGAMGGRSACAALIRDGVAEFALEGLALVNNSASASAPAFTSTSSLISPSASGGRDGGEGGGAGGGLGGGIGGGGQVLKRSFAVRSSLAELLSVMAEFEPIVFYHASHFHTFVLHALLAALNACHRDVGDERVAAPLLSVVRGAIMYSGVVQHVGWDKISTALI